MTDEEAAFQAHVAELARQVLAQEIEVVAQHGFAFCAEQELDPGRMTDLFAVNPIGKGTLRFILLEGQGLRLSRVVHGTRILGQYALTIGVDRALLAFEPTPAHAGVPVGVTVQNEGTTSRTLRLTAFCVSEPDGGGRPFF